MRRNRDWDDDGINPVKGPKGGTYFLKANYRYMQIGSSFHTVKARFPPALIRGEAAKAGFKIRIDDLSPWLRITVVGKLE